MKKVYLTIILIFIVGCSITKDFSYGVKMLNKLNSEYNVTIETNPKTIEKIDAIVNELKELQHLQLETGMEAFKYVIDYKLLDLEAEKLYMEAWKYGNAGTTADGFGCKQRPLIIESVQLRNSSALKASDAVTLLREFVDKYPEEAKFVNLSYKNALFLNATFYEIARLARRDSSIINNFCPKNVTLEIYQEEFRKKTNLSEDFISNLAYEQAVPIWKELSGIK